MSSSMGTPWFEANFLNDMLRTRAETGPTPRRVKSWSRRRKTERRPRSGEAEAEAFLRGIAGPRAGRRGRWVVERVEWWESIERRSVSDHFYDRLVI